MVLGVWFHLTLRISERENESNVSSGFACISTYTYMSKVCAYLFSDGDDYLPVSINIYIYIPTCMYVCTQKSAYCLNSSAQSLSTVLCYVGTASEATVMSRRRRGRNYSLPHPKGSSTTVYIHRPQSYDIVAS